MTRRRRLSAPGLQGGQTPDGKTLDANAVAAYLDNTLPANQVADVEGILLGSDVHLAEVASCHQILTRVLSEPVKVPESTRKRMLSIGPADVDGDGAADHEPAPPPVGAPTSAGMPAAMPAKSFSEGLPEHLRETRGGSWRWLAPLLVLGLLGAWAASLYFDSSLWNLVEGGTPSIAGVDGDPDGGADGLSPDAAARLAAEGDDGEADAAVAPGPAPAVPAPGTAVDPAEAERLARTLPQDPAPVEPGAARPAPQPAAPQPAAPQPAAPEGGRPATAAVPGGSAPEPVAGGASGGATMPAGDPAVADTVDAVLAEADAERAAAETGPPAAPLTAAESRGVYRYDADRDVWSPLPADAPLNPGEPFAVFEPFTLTPAVGEPAAAGGDGGETVPPPVLAVPGPTRFRPAGTAAVVGDVVVPARLTLERGRVRLSRPAGGGDAVPAAAVTAGGSTWVVRLLEPGTAAGVEVSPRRVVGLDAELTGPPVTARLIVAAGFAEVGLVEGGALAGTATVPAGRSLPLLDPDGPVPPGSSAPQPVAVGAMPEWVGGREPTAAAREAADAFAAALGGSQPASFVLPPLAADPRAFLAEDAASALALTDALDDLAGTLRTAEHVGAIRIAAAGLRLHLGRSAEENQRVRNALSLEFTPDEFLALERLLWGLAPEAAADSTESLSIVDLLESDRLAVRVLAIDEIARLTGETRGYQPEGNDRDRRSAVRRWRSLVEDRGGFVAGTP